ncbi:hypothetical protein [Cellulomonas soli]|uniref:Uncharacterized protein n=1 Tax=Cellulomonas soli TaxID=931535 RepID=A0A512PHT6_9CELL|nr:hypothetical protein [Cellulomonas soli]NYI59187.1 hypothetical protein [Cellulomonas soli]GEP70692.1 hypothetical protein CSO01_34070 [Cellulomonas soli]
MSAELGQVMERAHALSRLWGVAFDVSLAEHGDAVTALDVAIGELVADGPGFSLRYVELWQRLQPEVESLTAIARRTLEWSR